jgi:hypothetical protein
MGLISKYYNLYTKSVNNFELFHNQVINMPRPTFNEIPGIIKLLKSIASYIILIDKKKLMKPILVKNIYREIFENYKIGIVPNNNRNVDFENKYLNRTESFEFLYGDAGKCGRMFRHYIAFFTFLEFLMVDINENYRIVDQEALQELVLSNEDDLFDILRNRVLNINIKTNPFINIVGGIKVNGSADYRPARAILEYCSKIGRKATDFEISILLGRIDEIQLEQDIVKRALEIGKNFPLTVEDQVREFFSEMGWKNSDDLNYQYSASQNPDFKFKAFLILMDTFNLIKYDFINRSSTGMIELTDYSKKLLTESLPIELIDLQYLIEKIDDYTEDSNLLTDIIIRKRTETITNAIKNDSLLVEKINKRNIIKPIIKNNKRLRSRLVTELAKIKANYLDEVTQKPTFEGKNGRNYVEAHHIIEFNGEDGPDVTDNLICLGPQNHSLIHHASTNEIKDFYNTCKSRGILSFERFKNMIVKYKCLTKRHIEILFSKEIISKIDANELSVLIDQYGVDPIFIKSLESGVVEQN